MSNPLFDEECQKAKEDKTARLDVARLNESAINELQALLDAGTQGEWNHYWSVNGEGHADCGVTANPRDGHGYSVCRAPRYQTQPKWDADGSLITARIYPPKGKTVNGQPYYSSPPFPSWSQAAEWLAQNNPPWRRWSEIKREKGPRE